MDEKASLTAGQDLWTIPGVARLGIPALGVTDGPNGARGTTLPGPEAEPTTCVPCGSALGATWDRAVVAEVGTLLAAEARARGCQVLLAPTVNIPRSPLAGRNFECYSEDPLLSGTLAAAFIGGVQSRGVATTVKHFVGNDAEFERYTMSSVIDERTLREIYLVPFEHAVRHGGTLGVMTGYNRLNGRWCSEDGELLTDILRGEWGFDGFVLTDWYGVASTTGSNAAGVDLEMPGPGRAYGPALADAVRNGSVTAEALDDQVARLLSVYERVGLLDGGGDGELPPRPAPARRADVARRAATASIVLLQNTGILPLASSVRPDRRDRPQRRPRRHHGGRVGRRRARPPDHPPGGTAGPGRRRRHRRPRTGCRSGPDDPGARCGAGGRLLRCPRLRRRRRAPGRAARHRALPSRTPGRPGWTGPSPSAPAGRTGRRRRAATSSP